MKLFKTLKRKVGNAVLPVVGTILGLTILAGSVVGVALNSSKIVYRPNGLQQQSDARQILYLAAKYFCEEKNNTEKTDAAIRAELQAIFGLGLKITKETKNGEDIYYIWYPRTYNDGSNEYKVTDGVDNVTDWYRATIKLQELKSENAHNKDAELSDVLFRDAKIDEIYNVGNLTSTYMMDSNLIPKSQVYGTNMISKIETDIDTFDEVFKYVNDSGVLEIDDIAVALYGFRDFQNPSAIVDIDDKLEAKMLDGEEGGNKYSIVYNLGMLGGNYYWQDNNNNTNKTWAYRQEYDAEFLVGMMEYYHPEYNLSYDNHVSNIMYHTLSYLYDDTNDNHIITAKGYYLNDVAYNYNNEVSWAYNSTIEFANAMSEYVFWENIDRLALKIDAVKERLNIVSLARYLKMNGYSINSDETGYRSGNSGTYTNITNYIRNYVSYFTYEWTDDGITVYNHFKSGGYWDIPLTITDVDNALIRCGYTDDSTTVSSQKVYEQLLNREEIIRKIKYDTYYEEVMALTGDDLLELCNNANNFGTMPGTVTYYKYYYLPTSPSEQNYWRYTDSQTQDISYVVANNDFSQAILDYLKETITRKYITNGQKIGEFDIEFFDDDDKLIDQVQFLMVDGNKKVQINYHFNVKKRYEEKTEQQTVYKNGNGKQKRTNCYVYRYQYDNIYSGNTGDSIELPIAEFKEKFTEALISWYFHENVAVSEEEIALKIKETKDEIMQDLVTPIRYNYLPTTKLSELVGNNSSEKGMREDTVNLKLLTKYLEIYKTIIGATSSISIESTSLANSSLYDGCLELTINYKLNGSIPKSAVLYFKYLTNCAKNTHSKDPSTLQYVSGEANGNLEYVSIKDENGNEIRREKLLKYVPILTFDGNALTKENLNQFAICGVIPYKEITDENGNQIGAKITIDGQTYTKIGKNNINFLKNVDKNYFYNGDIEDLGERDFKIYIKTGCTLIINGKLNLLHNQTLELEDGAMILVNGDFLVFYEFNGKGNDSTDNQGARKCDPTSTYGSTMRSFDNDDREYFKARGVNIIAEDAKIMVNGNMTYRGYKARYTTNTRIMSAYAGTTNINYFFDQTTFGIPDDACQYDSSTTRYTHYSDECRSVLSGIYIVNGDVKFDSWSPYANSDVNTDMKQVMYGNSYSNPLINATFYVDGTFNMQGLYMNSLYDPCRANFIFAKSIVQPTVALNAALTKWSWATNNNTQYDNWQNTHGFLFMIVEDAIDFSKVNFGCVNLFTPYSQLINSINNNNNSSENFTDFVEKDRFTDMYPDVAITRRWGLSSLLLKGFEKMYDPSDIGAISVHNEVDTGVEV